MTAKSIDKNYGYIINLERDVAFLKGYATTINHAEMNGDVVPWAEGRGAVSGYNEALARIIRSAELLFPAEALIDPDDDFLKDRLSEEEDEREEAARQAAREEAVKKQ